MQAASGGAITGGGEGGGATTNPLNPFTDRDGFEPQTRGGKRPPRGGHRARGGRGRGVIGRLQQAGRVRTMSDSAATSRLGEKTKNTSNEGYHTADEEERAAEVDNVARLQKHLRADFVPQEEWQRRFDEGLCNRCGSDKHWLKTCPVEREIRQRRPRGPPDGERKRSRPKTTSGFTPVPKRQKQEPARKKKWTFAQVTVEGERIVIRNRDGSTPNAEEVDDIRCGIRGA